MVDTVRDSGRPDMPKNEGAIMVSHSNENKRFVSIYDMRVVRYSILETVYLR